MTDTHGIAGERLRSFIERIERIEEEIKDLNADKSDIYKEAKGSGFDVKVMRKLVQRRRMESADRDEQDTLLELYEAALEGGGASRVRAREDEGRPALRDIEGGPRDLTLTEVKDLLRAGIRPDQDFRFEGASIYFAHAPQAGLVKIGISKSVNDRVRTLSREIGEPLNVLCTIPGKRRDEIRQHIRFADLRVQGEWFEATEDLLSEIDALSRARTGGLTAMAAE